MVSINRVVMQAVSRRIIIAHGPSSSGVAIAFAEFCEMFTFKSYFMFWWPQFDGCAGPYWDDVGQRLDFDLIPSNQVLQHPERPNAARRDIYEWLRVGGFFRVAVRFFGPLHAAPQEVSHWSARCLKYLLIARGNRTAVLQKLEETWPTSHDKHRNDIRDDPNTPICAGVGTEDLTA